MKAILPFVIMVSMAATAGAAGGKTVTYEVAGAKYEGYYAKAGEKAPLVLLVHDWDGINDYEVKRSDMLQKMGYSVFAVDLFGAGARPTKMEEMRRLTGELYQDREKMRARLYGGLEAARSQGADIANAVAMGYCFGGAAVLELARSGADLKGFVAFHGGLETPQDQDYTKAKGKFLILHGTADTSVTMAHFADLAKSLEAAGIEHEMITYSGAPHAFTVFGTERYREDADRKSWERFTKYLSETLK